MFRLRNILIPISTAYSCYRIYPGAGIGPYDIAYLTIYIFGIRIARFQRR